STRYTDIRLSSHSVTCSDKSRMSSTATGSGPVTRSDGAAIPATALNRICTCRPSTVWKAHPRCPFGSETGFPATSHSSMCEPATTGLLAGRRSKDWAQDWSDDDSAVAEQGSRTWFSPSPPSRTRGCGNGARTLNRSVRPADGILAVHCLERGGKCVDRPAAGTTCRRRGLFIRHRLDRRQPGRGALWSVVARPQQRVGYGRLRDRPLTAEARLC